MSFEYDVFLSHSNKDKDIVRDVANRLKSDGVRVWFDEWVLKPGDSIPAKIEEGLEHSHVLVLCMSANAFGSDWAQLESYTFRFRDPLNKARRFIPLRLDDAPIKGSLAQFSYISWLSDDREQAYAKLLRSARPRDLAQLRDSLARIPALRAELAAHDSTLLADLADRCSEHTDEHAILKAAIEEAPSVSMPNSSRMKPLAPKISLPLPA